MFEDPRCIQNVVYYYRVDQPAFEHFRKENLVHHWVNQPPTEEDFVEKTSKYKDNGGSIGRLAIGMFFSLR